MATCSGKRIERTSLFLHPRSEFPARAVFQGKTPAKLLRTAVVNAASEHRTKVE